jgi:hypothetical protein
MAGCASSTLPGANPNRGGDGKKPSGGSKPGVDQKAKAKPNPLVGRWVMKKAGDQDWSDTVSKDAVIEFHGDGATPNCGTMTVTDRDVKGEGAYVYMAKDGFRFEVKFRRKDGTPLGGYGGVVNVTRLKDREMVGDLFTLERAK